MSEYSSPFDSSGQDAVIRDAGMAYEALHRDTELAFDLETSGLNPWVDKIAVVNLHGKKSGKSAVIHTRGGPIPDAIRALLENPATTLVGHNILGFDCPYLANAGVDTLKAGGLYDTLPAEAAVLVNNRRDVSLSLKDTIKRRLDKTLRKQIDHGSWMNETLTPEQIDYCIGDVRLLAALKKEHYRRADELHVRSALDLEVALAPTVLRMTLNGLPLDRQLMDDYLKRQVTEVVEAREFLYRAFGIELNLNSPTQLRKSMAVLGVELDSTKAETLLQHALGAGIEPDSWSIEQMADLFDTGVPGAVLGALLKYRHGNQRLKMYSDEWFAKYWHEGWLHSRFWQLGTETGRFSSRDPNLQQIPRDMRWVFSAPEGHAIISADYPQIEVRVMAYRAQDPVLLAACLSEDMHSEIAQMVYGVPAAQITKQQRKDCKAITFCKLFGGGSMTAWKYARSNGSTIAFEDMERIFRQFDQRFRATRQYINQAYAMADENDKILIKLPTGLKRMLIGDKVRGSVILNTRVQGTAAAGLKYALLECQRRGLDRYLGATVHDELVACVPDRQKVEYARELVEAMKIGMAQVLPDMDLPIEPAIGVAWGDDPMAKVYARAA